MYGKNIIQNDKIIEKVTDNVLNGTYCGRRFFTEFSIDALNEPSPRQLAKFVVRTLLYDRMRQKVDWRYERYFLWFTVGCLFLTNYFQYKYNSFSFHLS